MSHTKNQKYILIKKLIPKLKWIVPQNTFDRMENQQLLKKIIRKGKEIKQRVSINI